LARKILLADDSVTAQNMGRKILADAGYDVITVNNGSAALKKIAEVKPDLIVLDVYMPGYSGLEVCQRVKETGDTSRIPILLTVGKLEPFKPEEARRVRADGFIVKPFEASELLSALSKLEEKIVPRAEGSKPGRFARTIAVVEEGRYDKTMVAEEDSGWKDRIGFPSSKKKKEAETEDVDDSSIYNPVNKDLRTMIDRATVDRRTAQAEKPEDTRVDLAALAPLGLPKDVTPEEIAALAAAAAQIKGTIAGSAPESAASDKPSEVAAEPAVQAPIADQVEAKAPEAKSSESRPEEKVHAAAVEWKADAPAETKAEQKPESVAEKSVEAPAEAAPSSIPADAAEAIAPLEAVTYLAANTSANASESRSSSDEPVTMAVAAGANGAATPRWAAVATAVLPEEASLSLEQEMQKAYAAFAAAEMAYAPSAVAVAEAPQAFPPVEAQAEAQVQPMAASSAVEPVSVPESTPAGSAPGVPAHNSGAAVKNFEVAASASVEPPVVAPASEAAPVQPAEPESALVSGDPAASHAEVVDARVIEAKADESSASALPVAEDAPQEAASASAPPLHAEHLQTEAVQPEAVQPELAQPEPVQGERIESGQVQAEQVLTGQDREENAREEQGNQDQRLQELRHEDSGREESRAPQASDAPASGAISEFATPFIATPDLAPSVPLNETSAEQISANPSEQSIANPPASQSSSESAPSALIPVEANTEQPAPEPALQEAAPKESAKDGGHKESEIAATTAAAWASWRRIRETGDPRSAASPATPAKTAAPSKVEEESAEHAEQKNKNEEPPRETTAMAVAAGAEKAPEPIAAADSESDGGDIANIVDSVLADLRPKIVAEISKKMGKKK
jgi:two-component system chemotaxis response regulator CheY